MSEEKEIECCKRFLNWYNNEYKKKLYFKRTEDYFPILHGKTRWDFVVLHKDTSKELTAIEIKEIPSLKEMAIVSNFWKQLCSSMEVEAKGKIEGQFGIILPPILKLNQQGQRKLVQALVSVLSRIQTDMILNTPLDIGPKLSAVLDIWPNEKSRNMEDYDRYGEYRPNQLVITKTANTGLDINLLVSSLSARSVPERHKEALDSIFDMPKANIQLEVAKNFGISDTILLLAGHSFDDESLLKGYIHTLDKDYISSINCIFFVDIGSEKRVVKLYPC